MSFTYNSHVYLGSFLLLYRKRHTKMATVEKNHHHRSMERASQYKIIINQTMAINRMAPPPLLPMAKRKILDTQRANNSNITTIIRRPMAIGMVSMCGIPSETKKSSKQSRCPERERPIPGDRDPLIVVVVVVVVINTHISKNCLLFFWGRRIPAPQYLRV